jgi:hypothetical protein
MSLPCANVQGSEVGYAIGDPAGSIVPFASGEIPEDDPSK